MHDEPKHPGAGGDGSLLPDGAGHWLVGLNEVQAGAKQQPGKQDRGHFAWQQRDQFGSGSLHYDR